MRIGFDFDNTLCATNEALAEYIEKDFGVSIPSNPPETELISAYSGLPKDRHDAYFEYLCRNHFYKDIKPIKEYLKIFLSCLKNKDIDCYIITDRKKHVLSKKTFNIINNDSLYWLKKHAPKFDARRKLIFTQGNKVPVGGVLALDLYIDDKPEHVEKMGLHVCPSLLIHRSTNKFTKIKNSTRVRNAEELKKKINDILGDVI